MKIIDDIIDGSKIFVPVRPESQVTFSLKLENGTWTARVERENYYESSDSCSTADEALQKLFDRIKRANEIAEKKANSWLRRIVKTLRIA